MNLQEAFNKVVEHARKQNSQAMWEKNEVEGVCMYRTPEGKRCFIGALIPDSEYSESLERKNISRLDENGMLPPSLEGLPIGSMVELQSIHDHWEPEQWERKLKAFAKDNGLTFPEVQS